MRTFRHGLRTVFVLLAAAVLQPACHAAQDVLTDAQARRVYELHSASVAVIRVIPAGAESHKSSGTGFVARADGLMLTNYHVVADKVLEPERYRLQFTLPDGRRGELAVIAVDALNDLAVVAGDFAAAKPLPFRGSVPAQGDRAFSLGYPLEQRLTITEGTYNGVHAQQYRERYHFTGALNPGMSGGPAVDAAGRVFGVNVTVDKRGQLVGGLIPARFAEQLLARASRDTSEAALRAELASQLKAHGDEIMRVLLTKPLPVLKLGRYSIPAKSAEFMSCGADSQRAADKPYTKDTYVCETASALYVSDKVRTGSIAFSHVVYRNTALTALGFAQLQQNLLKPGDEELDRDHYTAYACDHHIVALKGTKAKVVRCLRGYRHVEGLYDVYLRLVTVDDSRESLSSIVDIEGVPFEPAQAFTRKFIEAIRWDR